MSSLFKESDFPKDFLFQVGSLFVSILVVHTIYLLFIDPAATLQVVMAESENRAPNRTLAIILKDFEQETCIMLAIWALSIMFIKWQRIKEQTQILTLNILGEEADEYINLEKIVLIEEELEKQERDQAEFKLLEQFRIHHKLCKNLQLPTNKRIRDLPEIDGDNIWVI